MLAQPAVGGTAQISAHLRIVPIVQQLLRLFMLFIKAMKQRAGAGRLVWLTILVSTALLGNVVWAQLPPPLHESNEPPGVEATAWILIEMSSGQILTSFRPEKKVEPASLTKIMTAYLVFEALNQKKIKLDQKIIVMPEAAAANQEGSLMFLKANTQVSIDQLLRGLIIDSGNDAALSLAYTVGGSESAFVDLMNRKAQQLNMTSTHFQNASGLPHRDHISSVRDLALLALALIRDFPTEYQRYYSQKEFTYGGIRQKNRNSLLFVDSSVDGVKTGHTESAGFNLIASAKRNGRRLISVVVGAVNDKSRAYYSKLLLDWGFDAFRLYNFYTPNSRILNEPVWYGDKDEIPLGFSQGLSVALPRNLRGNLEGHIILPPRLMAPLSSGQIVGKIRLVDKDGKGICEVPLSALQAVTPATAVGRFVDHLLIRVKKPKVRQNLSLPIPKS